jgi:hypothetical protein
VANRLEHRLVAAANADLRRHRFVAPVDVLIGVGWLSREHAEAWRRRRVPYLEQVTEASLGKLSSALRPGEPCSSPTSLRRSAEPRSSPTG